MLDPRITAVVIWSTTYIRPGKEPVTKLLPSWDAVLNDAADEFADSWAAWVAAHPGEDPDVAEWAEDFRPERYGATWHAEEHTLTF